MTSIIDLTVFLPRDFPENLSKLKTVELVLNGSVVSAADLVKMQIFAIAKLLVDMEISAPETAINDAALLSGFIANCLKTSSSTSSSTAVIKTFDELSLKEALEAVNADPENIGLRSKLRKRLDVRMAQNFAGLAIYVGKDKQINVELTERVITNLLDGQPFRDKIDGEFLVDLNFIFASQQKAYIHPITLQKLGSDMVDDLGFDFSLILEEVKKAYIWFNKHPQYANKAVKDELNRLSVASIYDDMCYNGRMTQVILKSFSHYRDTLKEQSAINASIDWDERYVPVIVQTNQVVSPTTYIYSSELSLLKLVTDYLSDDDFSDICQNHFPRVYQNFTSGQTLGLRKRNLVDYASRQGMTNDLYAAIYACNRSAPISII